MTPIELVVSKLPDPKRIGSGWSARCPAHEDQDPSLSVSEGDDGRALLHCHAGCETPDIVAALGLTMADLMADNLKQLKPTTRRPRKTKSRRYPTAREAVAELERRHGPRSVLWTYHNAEGQPVGLVVRWDLPESGKDIRPVSRNGEGWVIGVMSAPRPLYCLPDLAKAKRVYVSEGEPPTEATRSVGLTATTSAGGSNAPHKTDWTPLADKEVVILPDNDDPGRKYAAEVPELLDKVRPSPTVRIVALPDLPEGGDMVEYLAARRAEGLDDAAIRAEIEAMADAADPIESEHPARVTERFKAFPMDVLPEPVRGFVSVGAEAMCCDPSFIALPILSALASAIGNTRRIALKPGWDEPPIIWTGIVGDSGTMKSPAMELALRPIRERQRKAMREHADAMVQYRDELILHERDLALWKSRKADGDPPIGPELPVPDRCWCDDTTVEALAVLLLNQWRGLLMVRDELAGWIAGFDRYKQGKGSDVAKWLEMFGGRSIIVDRKTTGPLYVPRAAASIAGGIQPETLRRALKREHRENGLAARLLLAWPPRKPKRWTEAGVDSEAEMALAGTFGRLYELQPTIDDDGEPWPVVIGLTPEGKRAWVAFYNAHAEEHANLTGDLSAVWSKLEGYAARLALVVHLTRRAAGDPTLKDSNAVDEQSITAGVVMSRWFGREARRVYAMLDESEADGHRRRLVELIRNKGGSVTRRDLMRCSWRVKTAEEAETLLTDLADAGAGRWEDIPTAEKGGRPTRRFVLADTIDTDKTPSDAGKTTGCVNVNTVNEAQDDWGEV